MRALKQFACEHKCVPTLTKTEYLKEVKCAFDKMMRDRRLEAEKNGEEIEEVVERTEKSLFDRWSNTKKKIYAGDRERSLELREEMVKRVKEEKPQASEAERYIMVLKLIEEESKEEEHSEDGSDMDREIRQMIHFLQEEKFKDVTVKQKREQKEGGRKRKRSDREKDEKRDDDREKENDEKQVDGGDEELEDVYEELGSIGSNKQRGEAARTATEVRRETERKWVERQDEEHAFKKEGMGISRRIEQNLDLYTKSVAGYLNIKVAKHASPSKRPSFTSSFPTPEDWFKHLAAEQMAVTLEEQNILMKTVGNRGHKYLKFFSVQKLVQCGLDEFVAAGYVDEANKYS